MEIKRNVTIFEGQRLNLEETIPLEGPLLVHIETTNRCNFKCVFCPESDDSYQELAGGYSSMAFEDFKRIVDELSVLGQHPRMINFFVMGEPLMNKRIAEYISYAREVLPQSILVLSTNGALLTENKFQPLCDSGLDFLRISIFGQDNEAHQKNTQTNVDLSKIRENVKAFVTHRDLIAKKAPYVFVKSILSPQAEVNKEFLRYFSDIGDERVFEGLSNWNDDSDRYSSKMGVKAEDLESSEFFQHKKYVCTLPFYSMVIHGDLQVSVCCIDWNKKTLVGNLKFQSVSDVWNGEALHQFRLKHLERRKKEIPACANCTYHHTLRDNLDSLDTSRYLERLGPSRPLSATASHRIKLVR